MKGTILETIINLKKERIAADKRRSGMPGLKEIAARKASLSSTRPFLNAVTSRLRINVIAEFKRASPSKGLIEGSADPLETAIQYERAGAAAISVLTEEDHFLGSLGDLESVRSAVTIPVLRKDFIIDEYQVFESAAAGANAILLIAAVLSAEQLFALRELAEEFSLDAIVEVHDERELEIAISSGGNIIGVNNRNLKTFDVDLGVSRRLIDLAPTGTVMISESGLTSATEVKQLHALGYSAFLIGETLMKSGDSTGLLKSFTEPDDKITAPTHRASMEADDPR